jgi:hypothetical protein
VPSKSVRLLGLSALLAVATITLAVWAVSAFRYASTTHSWPTTYGNVVAVGAPTRSTAAVRFADTLGHSHLMPLKAGDTDDLPVGSVIRISYDVAADGRTRSEFAVQPGARASALTVLALLAGLASGIAVWRSKAERPERAARASAVPTTEERPS